MTVAAPSDAGGTPPDDRGPASAPAAVATRGPGRPTDDVDRRADILAAARREFASRGFDQVSVRGIAREARVDPSLVHHYFGSKQDVFVAAVQFPPHALRIVQELFDGPSDEVGQRLVRHFLGIYEDAVQREPVLALLRSAMGQESAATMVREFVTAALIGPAAAHLGVAQDEARLRAELAIAQLVGVAMLRYVIKAEPVASVPVDELVRRLGPVVQAHFDATLINGG